MTIIFEHREVKKKTLLVQFRFNKHTVKVRRSHVEGYTLDKYLTLDTWSQIYTKLTDPIDDYTKDETKRPESTTVKMNRAQLNLKISWTPMDSTYRQIGDMECMDSENICPMVMTVHIDMWSLIDKYKKEHQSKPEPKPATNGNGISSASSVTSATSTSSTTSTTTTAKQLPIKSPMNNEPNKSIVAEIAGDGKGVEDEEYVPIAMADVGNGLQYTPSTVIISALDEYTPTNVGDPEQIVTYTPTKIAKSQSDEGVRQAKKYGTSNKTDVNRNDSSSKRHRTIHKVDAMSDLFGDSDDGDVGRMTRSSKKVAQIRNVTQRKGAKGATGDSKAQTDLSKWFSCKTDAKVIEANKKRRLDSVDAETPLVQTETKESNSRKEPISELDRMKLLTAKLDKQVESLNRAVEPLDLMELSPKEIVATFQEHQKSLEQFFDLYKNAPEYAFPKLGYDGTKFIQTLLTENQQKAMVNKMKATFCPDEEYGVTAFSNLLWKVMLPEWALECFILKYLFKSREKAIEHLNIQNDAALPNMSFDFDITMSNLP